MSCSPKRLAANRANAARSCGPKTAEGKERSRANALKHGLTGDGVVLPPDDLQAADAVAGQLEAELKPTGAMGKILLRRVAVLSVRLDRCARHDAAMTAKRVRDSGKELDAAVHAEADALIRILGNDPPRIAARLRETPEGIDRMIQEWDFLRSALNHPEWYEWNTEFQARVRYALGRSHGAYPPLPVEFLTRAIRGDFSGLVPDQGGDLTPEARQAWARTQVAAVIDAEVAALRELRQIRVEEVARDRAEAADRALFDPSPEAERARKYEAATERGMFRALREFQKLEAKHAADAVPPAQPATPAKQAAPAKPVVSVAAGARPVGSFCQKRMRAFAGPFTGRLTPEGGRETGGSGPN